MTQSTGTGHGCRSRILLSCLLLLLAGTAAAAEAGWIHALRPADGVVYGRRLFYSQKMLVGIASLNGEIARTITLDISIRKEADQPDGGAMYSATYDFLHYSEDGITGRYGYNSRDRGPVPPAIRDLAPLIGRSFMALTDGKGKITAVTAHGSSADEIFALFPQSAVAVGESWPWTLTFLGTSPAELSSTLTLKGMNEKSATIGIRSVLKPGPPTAAAPDNGMVALGIGLSGTQEGEFDIDRATGLPTRGSIRQHFSGTIRLAPGGRLRLPSGQISVPMTGEGMLTLSSY